MSWTRVSVEAAAEDSDPPMPACPCSNTPHHDDGDSRANGNDQIDDIERRASDVHEKEREVQ